MLNKHTYGTFTDLFTTNDVTPFSLSFMCYTLLFCFEILKIYPIRHSFIYLAYLNFNPDVHNKAKMTTTHKGPIMPPSKFHNSLNRPYILPKRLWLIWVIPLHQSLCQVPKNSEKLHQEWASVVDVAKVGGLRSCVASAEGLACKLHCARLA